MILYLFGNESDLYIASIIKENGLMLCSYAKLVWRGNAVAYVRIFCVKVVALKHTHVSMNKPFFRLWIATHLASFTGN